MLLSLVGVPREDKGRHRGAELALAVERLPPRSKVFRKLRRGADLENIRPDYQDLLTDLDLWVWVRQGVDASDPCLADRVRVGLVNPASITRAGGLSLGESSYLVDSVSVATAPTELVFVTPDPAGFYSLPVWVDHVAANGTRVKRFRVDDAPRPVAVGLPDAWVRIPRDGEPE
jgi:CRISPR-associated protein Cas5t